MARSPYQPRRLPGRSGSCGAGQIREISRLNAKIENLKKDNAELQKRVDALEVALESLEITQEKIRRYG